MTPRQRKRRFLSPFVREHFYKPRGVPLSGLEVVDLKGDELEAMRLCDLEDLDQEKAAERMGISRGTLQRLLYLGRKKVAEALLNGKAIHITFPGYVSFRPTLPQGWGFGKRFRRGRR